MARNRKRAKERRARRPQPVARVRSDRAAPERLDRAAPPEALDSAAAPEPLDRAAPERLDRAAAPEPLDRAAPGPLGHAAPDVELAEAQLALGRSELTDGAAAPEPEDEAELGVSRQGGNGFAVRAGEGGEGSLASAVDPAGGPLVAGRERGGVLPGERRISVGERLVGFLQGSWRELQRVQWPDRRQVAQATGVVIGFVIVAGVWLGVADTLASKLVDYILK